MAIRELKLPLFNDSFYSYSVPLEGNQYSLDFLFIERLGEWFVTLKASDNTVLVRNQRLTTQTPLFGDYKLADLTGAFYFKQISVNTDEDLTKQKLLEPRRFYELFYIFDDGD